MLMDRAAIAKLIPHQGEMCVLDAVVEYDRRTIVCSSVRHQRTDQPLRRDARLDALHACEYAAQAVAVHGAILAREDGARAPGRGYLAALTDVSLHALTLDENAGALRVRAERLLGEGTSFIYSFEVAAGALPIADGRLTVVSAST